MISVSNFAYFWIAVFLSLLLFALNLFTIKRIQFFRKRDIIRILMWSGIVLFLGMALSAAKLNWEITVPVKEKMEIIFALDVSLSSLAKDVEIKIGEETKKISRLDMEKQVVENVLGNLKGDAISLTIFADTAIPLQHVLSREDYQNSLLRNLKYIDEDFVRYEVKQGTDYGNLLFSAMEQFEKNEKKKLLFILTDGEPQGNEEKLRETLSKALRQFDERKDIAVYLIGVGNPRELSKIIKIEDENGNPKEYYTHKNGEFVLTRPDLEFLTSLANATGGHYIHADSNKNLKAALITSIEQERRVIGWEKKTEAIDLAPYLLICSLIFLFIIPIIKST